MANAIYNLSPLTGGGFPDPDRAGTWFASPGSLSELAARLRAPEGGRVQDAKSVPDVWAQPRTFADAVIQGAEGHPHGASAIQQWRALVALFALGGELQRRYRISLRPVRLSADGSRFDKVLLATSPSILIAQNAVDSKGRADWHLPYLISIETVRSTGSGTRVVHDKPRIIGMMNPACLVSPGKGVGREPIATIPWMAGDDWVDPLTLTGEDALSSGELKALREYLYDLIDGLREAAGPADDPVLSAIVGRLDDFAADCEGAEACPFAVRSTPTAGDENAPHIYRLMRTSVVIEEDVDVDPAAISECRISLRGDLGERAPFKGVILVDPAIADARGKNARDILVWRTKNLAALSTNEAEFAEARKEAAQAGYLLVKPEALFTEKLLKLGRKAKIEGHPGPFNNALIPLSPLVLLLQRPDQIISSVDLRSEGAGREAATLRVTLDAPIGPDGSLGRPSEHRVRKVYSDSPSGDRGELVEEAVWTYGGAAIWPNVVSSQWNWYFARLTYNVKQPTSVRGRLATSGASIAEFLSPMDGLQREVELRGLTSQQGIQTEITPLAGSSFTSAWLNRIRLADEPVPEEIQQSPRPFEAIFFSYAEGDGDLPVPAGMTLLRPAVVAETLRRGLVAIDFGTTNSVACFDDHERVTFKSRLLHPIESDDKAWMNAVLPYQHWPFVEFFPLTERPTPTPTVMLSRALGSDGALPPKVRESLLFSSVMYFQPDLELREGSDDLEKFKSVLNRLKFNLKWDDQPETRAASEHFLRQLMMMVSLEALVSGRNPDLLRWRFSRPDAMREENAEFSDVVSRQLAEIRPNVSISDAILPLCSEGKAAANYVISGGVNSSFVPGVVNVVLDIGGGTTDVAIWANNKPVWRGSFRLAGQDFFTAHMIRNPELLGRLDLGVWATILQPSSGERIDSARLPYVGELLFSGPVLEKAMDDSWPRNSGTPECKALVNTSRVFLGGIVWYLGLVVKGLVERGLLDKEDLRSTTFALCGRGSGMFNRLHRGASAHEDSPASQVLKLFQTSAGLDGPAPRISVSSTPKLEVVNGMVLDNAALDLDSPDEDSHEYEPGGLDLPFGDDQLQVAADIFDDLPEGSPGRPDLAELDRFLDALAANTRVRLDIHGAGDQSAAANIRTKVFNALNADWRKRSDKPWMKEPPFITALRILLDDVTTPGQNGRIVVQAEGAGTRRERGRS